MHFGESRYKLVHADRFGLSEEELSPSYNASCYVDDSGKLNIEIGDAHSTDADAWAIFTNSINQTGWDQFRVKGNEGHKPSNILRCAGALEGYLSREQIWNHFRLIKEMCEFKGSKDEDPRYANLLKYLENNKKHIRDSVDAYTEVLYWKQVGRLMEQFDGFVEGYNMIQDEKNLDENELYLLQSLGDAEDIADMVPDVPSAQGGPTLQKSRRKNPITPGEHCSGLVRLLPDYSEIYFSHDTWSDYRDLHGELKEYDFPGIPEYKAQRVVLSTRIGMFSSIDDFYVNDQGLFVLETTMNNFNSDLQAYISYKSVFTWMRAILGMWSTDSGKEWTDRFAKYNSGTYNNQYIVVDSKKFTRYQKPDTDLLWMIEQFPGTTKSADITDTLLSMGYFPSINTPWFPEMFELGGYPEKVASWGADGNYWDLNTSARFLIYKREVPYITNFEQFKQFMIYNNWKRDLYSNGDSGQQILARYDQRQNYGNEHFPARGFGGLDSKVLKLTDAITKMRFYARASPAYENNPVWEFGEGEFKDLNYYGLPKRWEFNWTMFESSQPEKCRAHDKKEDECLNDKGCGWCTYNQKCFAGDKDSPWLDIQCEAGWKVKSELQSWAIPLIVSVCVIVVIFAAFVYGAHYYRVYKEKKGI